MRPVRAKSCFARPLRSTACCASASPLPKRTCWNGSGGGQIERIKGSYRAGDACSEDGPFGQLGLVPVVFKLRFKVNVTRGTYQRNMIGIERMKGISRYNTEGMQKDKSNKSRGEALNESRWGSLNCGVELPGEEIALSHYPFRNCIRTRFSSDVEGDEF